MSWVANLILPGSSQIIVVQILDKDAYNDLTGAWQDDVRHPRHNNKHLANKNWPSMLKSVFDKLKLHDFPSKIVLCSAQHAGFSHDEYRRCGERSALVKENIKASQKKQKDPADVWGTAYSTAFEFPTADPIISKLG